MNKKIFALFTFLLVITSVSHTVFAQTSGQPQGRMMSPELQYCTLPPVKFMQGVNVAGTHYQMFLGYFTERYSDGLELMKKTPILPDGKFGKITKEYTKFVQRKAGLVPDGIAGPKTRKVLTDFCLSSGLYDRMPYVYGGEAIGSDNSYVKKVSLGNEFTMKAGESVNISETGLVVSLVGTYGNRCSAQNATTPNAICTMEYSPAVKLSAMFGGDVTISPTPAVLLVGESSSLSIGTEEVYMLKLVSFSDEENVAKFVVIKV